MMFLRLGVQRDYSKGEKEIFFSGNNVELPLVSNSLKIKRFSIDISYYRVRGLYGKNIGQPGLGSKQLRPYCQEPRADMFPVQTEQTRNIYRHMANTFEI